MVVAVRTRMDYVAMVWGGAEVDFSECGAHFESMCV